MPRPNRKADDTERWASEGGADPTGPATHVPAVDKRRLRTGLEPPSSPNPPGESRVSHVTHASDSPADVAESEEDLYPANGGTMKSKLIRQLVLLSAAAAGGFWLSRRLAGPTLNHVPIDTSAGGVRLVAAPGGKESA